MPFIEIVCIGQNEITHFHNLPFLVEAENRLIGHREPVALFQIEFDEYQGCIYHLLNPTESWDAYLLLDTSAERWEKAPEADKDSLIGLLRFLPEYAPAVYALLETLLEESPVGQILFTSDYPYGPEIRFYKKPLTLENFWKLHEADRLHVNAFYHLYHGRYLNPNWRREAEEKCASRA